MLRKSGGEIEPNNFLPPCCTFNAILASTEKQAPEEESVFYCQHNIVLSGLSRSRESQMSLCRMTVNGRTVCMDGIFSVIYANQ